MLLTNFDLAIVAIYAFALIGIALFVSKEPAGQTKDTEDYFLAGKSLPWWAIGASLIASNISAEQIIGMSGQGYAFGLAIAAYEWQAAIVLLVVAKYFLPIFLKQKIYTMPQFLDQRYGGGVKTLMSVFWIALYTLVNLTTVLWLGGQALVSLTGWPIFAAMAALAAFAVFYSIYGGLKAVALTDIVQVVVLIMGGVAITWMALGLVGGAGGPVEGFMKLMGEIPGHFKMMLPADNASYNAMPGIWTLLGGLWVLHFSYWGFNQYIIQRALGAQSLGEAQKGLVFAAFLKLIVPFIVVIPGIAAVHLAQTGQLDAPLLNEHPDKAYGELMSLMPSGLKGLIFAGLIAAIVSSLASMMNSISTIFTMDIYKGLARDKSEGHYVLIGRITALLSIMIAVLAAKPFLQGLSSGFQAIQEYTGFIAPGVVAIFLLGFFWKRMNTPGAFAVLLGSVGFSILMKFQLGDMPFVVRIWIVFLACLAAGVIVALMTGKPREDQPVKLSQMNFATSGLFNVLAALVIALFAGLYVIFW